MVPVMQSEKHDIATDVRQKIAPLIKERSHCSVAHHSNKIYIAGGYTTSDSVEVYDVFNNTSLLLSFQLPTINNCTTLAADQSVIYIFQDKFLLTMDPNNNTLLTCELTTRLKWDSSCPAESYKGKVYLYINSVKAVIEMDTTTKAVHQVNWTLS